MYRILLTTFNLTEVTTISKVFDFKSSVINPTTQQWIFYPPSTKGTIHVYKLPASQGFLLATIVAHTPQKIAHMWVT